MDSYVSGPFGMFSISPSDGIHSVNYGAGTGTPASILRLPAMLDRTSTLLLCAPPACDLLHTRATPAKVRRCQCRSVNGQASAIERARDPPERGLRSEVSFTASHSRSKANLGNTMSISSTMVKPKLLYSGEEVAKEFGSIKTHGYFMRLLCRRRSTRNYRHILTLLIAFLTITAAISAGPTWPV